ncbi:rhomboid family intramembrane serine protease [Aureicoccus marinus]|jgi:membrane associated rhomboid family serine protease|uniref:Rhomboid family intramembrane serine protease n=1 Tax=Aureicoccus marinus TaxID=754435 RepID=A0A2S7T627_9FLAO|nr:rhomboid family intramembrane serine protease [Aureicoccus marinus]PQJ14977.1 rhomboid family intramembrane serine protease [Aureicoccus marinus]
MPSIEIATLALILLNVVVTMKGFGDSRFFDRYKFQVGAIKARQWDRMFTSGFLHVDNRHLLFNMVTLYFFANVVIYAFGDWRFLLIYGVSLFTGSLLALSFHRNEPYYSAVGASGAVTGILYSAILLQPDMTLALMFIPIPLPAYVLGILYLLYSIYGMKTRVGNIGHTAHFGGAIGGYATTLVFSPYLLQTDTFIVLIMAVPIVLMFILERLGKL